MIATTATHSAGSRKLSPADVKSLIRRTADATKLDQDNLMFGGILNLQTAKVQ
jgi:hypothetical protein